METSTRTENLQIKGFETQLRRLGIEILEGKDENEDNCRLPPGWSTMSFKHPRCPKWIMNENGEEMARWTGSCQCCREKIVPWIGKEQFIINGMEMTPDKEKSNAEQSSSRKRKSTYTPRKTTKRLKQTEAKTTEPTTIEIELNGRHIEMWESKPLPGHVFIIDADREGNIFQQDWSDLWELERIICPTSINVHNNEYQLALANRIVLLMLSRLTLCVFKGRAKEYGKGTQDIVFAFGLDVEADQRQKSKIANDNKERLDARMNLRKILHQCGEMIGQFEQELNIDPCLTKEWCFRSSVYAYNKLQEKMDEAIRTRQSKT